MEADIENLLCAGYFSYVIPFHPHDISVRWIFPSISQVGKLRYRLDRRLKPLARADAALQSSDCAWFCGTPKLVLSAASQHLSVLQEAATEACPGIHFFLLRMRRPCLLSREGRLKSM